MQVITVTQINLGYYQDGEMLLGIFETMLEAERCKSKFLEKNKNKGISASDIDFDYINLGEYQFDT